MTKGFSACKAELAALLTDVKQQVEAAGALSGTKRANAFAAQARRLDLLVSHSEPQDPLDQAEVDALERLKDVASETAIAVNAAQVASAVAAIAARSAELATIGAELDQHSLDNVSAAKRLRLTPIRDAITQMTAVVGTAKMVAGELKQDNPDEAQIVTAVEDLASQLETLRKALGNAASGAG